MENFNPHDFLTTGKCPNCYEKKKELKKANKGAKRLKDDLAIMTEIAEEFEVIIEIYKEALEEIASCKANKCDSLIAKEALKEGDDT